jgi:hypothetical protein
MKTQNRVRAKNSPVAKSTQTKKRTQKSASKSKHANPCEVTVRLCETLREHARAEAAKCGENSHEFMVHAIRLRTCFGDAVDLARRFIGSSYNRLRFVTYGDAIRELGTLVCIIPYHPNLSPFRAAIRDIGRAEEDLQMFRAEGNAASAAGNLSARTAEERAAEQWFEAFYQKIQQKDFYNAQLEFSGFYPWIKHQREYSHVASALAKFTAAADVLDGLLEEAQY